MSMTVTVVGRNSIDMSKFKRTMKIDKRLYFNKFTGEFAVIDGEKLVFLFQVEKYKDKFQDIQPDDSVVQAMAQLLGR